MQLCSPVGSSESPVGFSKAPEVALGQGEPRLPFLQMEAP